MTPKSTQSLKKDWLLFPKMARRIWWILIRSVASLKICTLMCYFCRKYIMFEPKKYRGVMCHNVEELTGALKNDMGISNFDPALESLKIYTLMGSFWTKYIMFALKKYREVMFHDTKECCEIWTKTDLFGKWHEEFDKFLPEHLKFSKLRLCWDPFIQSRKSMSFKLTESYVSWQWRMMENLTRKWIVISKLTWGIWRMLTRALESLKYLHFNWLLSTKVYKVWAEKV